MPNIFGMAIWCTRGKWDQENKLRFFGGGACGFGSFLFRLLVLLSCAGSDPWGVLLGSFADSGFFVEFARSRREASLPVEVPVPRSWSRFGLFLSALALWGAVLFADVAT